MCSIKNLPNKFKPLRVECVLLLKQGRKGNLHHAKNTVEFILNYQENIKFD